MNRESEANLLAFCVRQHAAFEESAWLDFSGVGEQEMAAAVLFLAGVDWYGNREQLRWVARRRWPEFAGSGAEMIRQARFDCGRFSNMLRRELSHERPAS